MKKKILLVSPDSKVVLQMRQWIRELAEETVVEQFPTIAEFAKAYPSITEEPAPVGAATVTAPDPVSAPSSEEPVEELSGEAPKVVAQSDPIRLIVIDVDALPCKHPHDKQALEWLRTTREELTKRNGAALPESVVRVMIVTFQHAPIVNDVFIDEIIDDLLVKPLDHELVLQKLAMALSDKKSTSGTFLFKQKTHAIVEMVKESTIEAVAEFGVAIVNPSPIAPGVYAHLYSKVFGEKNPAVWGRVIRTKRYKQDPTKYLTYFSFFGITSEQLHNVRVYVQNQRRVHNLDPFILKTSAFKGLPCHIAVIDHDEKVREAIKSTLEGNFSNSKVHSFRSYSQFLKQISHASKEALLNLSEESPGGLPGDNDLSFYVTGESYDLTQVEPALDSDQRFCGIFANDILATPSKWLGCIDDADREEFDEYLTGLRDGSGGRIIVRLRDTDGFHHPVQITGHLERAGQGDGSKLLRLDFHAIANDEWIKEMENRRHQGGELETLSALFIDASGLRDLGPWYEGLRTLLQKNNVLKGEILPICLMSDEKNKYLNPADLRLKVVSGFMFKPIDRKVVMSHAVEMVPGLLASTDAVDMRFIPANVPVHLGKEIEMDEISEFGLQIVSKVPLREGVFLRFYSSLFLDEKGEGVVARCTSCEPDANNKDTYFCFFSFFAVTDEFLKHIRTWIREDYVAKKENDG